MAANRRAFLAGVSAIALCGFRGGLKITTGITTFAVLPVGAGGFSTGIDIAPDGTKVVRNDVSGGFIWDASISAWRQLITANTMPIGAISNPTISQINWLGGVWELRIAYSQTTTLYMLACSNPNGGAYGLLYKSTNSGRTWTLTNLPQINASAGGISANFNSNTGPQKLYGEKMIVDPANPNIVAVAVPTGINVSLDGGATWNVNGTIPAPSSLWSAGLAFDSSGGTTGSGGSIQTNNVYLTSYGNGVWFSSTGISGTFTKIADGAGLGGPTTVITAQVDFNGVYVCCDGTTIWKWASGAWTELKPKGTVYAATCVCVDPRQAFAGSLVVSGNAGAGQIYTTTDYGGAAGNDPTHWKGPWQSSSPGGGGYISQSASDIPWLAIQVGNLTLGNMRVDPITGDTYITSGIGVYHAAIPSTFLNFAWASQSLGIESMVTNDIIAPAGGFPIAVFQDRAAFVLDPVGAYPSTYGPLAKFNFGGAADYASNDPTFVCVRAYDTAGTPQEISGYATLSGASGWTLFPGAPTETSNGGMIAAATSSNIVVVPSNGALHYTTDQGATWHGGTGTSFPSVWNSSFINNAHIVAADRVSIGTFYAYQFNSTTSKLWQSTDGGATWAVVWSGTPPFNTFTAARLRTVPGNAGQLFFTIGYQIPNTGSVPVNSFFQICSVSAGVGTFTNISKANGFTSDVKEVFDFGFGLAKPGNSYPTIFIGGWVDGVWGIWRCDGFNPASPGAETWTNLTGLYGGYPNANTDAVKVVNGDMSIYGRVYVGFAGSGFVMGTLH